MQVNDFKNIQEAIKYEVLQDGEIIIVDEFTGRLMFGRRYSDGLHQAIETNTAVKFTALII